MIHVESLDTRTFKVTVDGRSRTEHTVSVAPDYHQQLTGGRISAAELVRRSFEFLLEREPNTSILERFELPVIARYFPDYEEHMRRQLG